MKLFGTDGIRGRANAYPLNPEFIVGIGKACADYFRGDGDSVILGGDTRQSTSMISSALVAGLNAKGVNVIVANIIPTPIVAWLAKRFSLKCGIMVSASHNPWQDNGIKFFKTDGLKLTQEEEAEFEKLIFAQNQGSCGQVGYVYNFVDWQEPYLEHIESLFEMELSGLKLVVDCANGATAYFAARVFERFGAAPELLNISPDGCNINEGCGAEHTEPLAKEVLSKRADIGIAFDGDGDRLMLIDEKGQLVDGDAIIAMIATQLKQQGRLNGGKVVATEYSNLGLAKRLEAEGIGLEIVAPGDRNIAQHMLQKGYVLGGEPSGHIILSELETTGNGLLNALCVLQLMHWSKLPLSKLNCLNRYPQVMLNVEVDKKPPIKTLKKTPAAIRAAEARLGSTGRVFVRYSGTQELARVMVEAQDKALAESCAAQIAKAIKEEL
jgi:phosphoglucosamine mutase